MKTILVERRQAERLWFLAILPILFLFFSPRAPTRRTRIAQTS
jgi:hypothetical protein